MEYIIYKIVCKDVNVKSCYVGSSSLFSEREKQHKYSCNNNKLSNVKLYRMINKHGGWNNWSMIKIQSIVGDQIEARKREQYWFETLGADLNSVCPYSSHKHICAYNTNRKSNYNTNKNPCKSLLQNSSHSDNATDVAHSCPEVANSDQNNCNRCSKSFATKSGLNKHSKICKGVSSLQCPNCLKFFADRTSKHKHIKNVKC